MKSTVHAIMPDAGNSHVRFDERTCIPKSSVRSALLSNIKQTAAVIITVMVVCLAQSASAGIASATSSTMASFSSFAASSVQTPTGLDGGFHSFVSQTVETDTLTQFNSREPRGTKIILR